MCKIILPDPVLYNLKGEQAIIHQPSGPNFKNDFVYSHHRDGF